MKSIKTYTTILGIMIMINARGLYGVKKDIKDIILVQSKNIRMIDNLREDNISNLDTILSIYSEIYILHAADDSLYNILENIQDTPDRKKCVGFMPTIGDFVYKDITDSQVSDKFYEQYGVIINKNNRHYVQMDVFEYNVKGDCVEHINRLGYDRLQNI